MSFEAWLADLMGQGEREVERLLGDTTATHFLMAWSFFESKCFNGYMKLNDIGPFCQRIVKDESFDADSVSQAASHFHSRYQDKEMYRHLMHGQTSAKMDELLTRPFSSLQPEDVVFIVALTAYRYRNNIFHGNKGVESWLNFKPQIEYCIEVMKAFVNHAESLHPSMQTLTAA